MDADASTLRMGLMHEAEKQGVVHHFLSFFSHVARVGVGLPARSCCTVKPRQQEPEFPVPAPLPKD